MLEILRKVSDILKKFEQHQSHFHIFQPATCSGSFEYNSQDSFDTDEEEYLDDDSDAESDKPIEMADNSHLNQFSYSWKVITLCVLKVVLNGITNFLTAAGLEVSGKHEYRTASPVYSK